MVEQWNSDGGTQWCNGGNVMVEQCWWNIETVIVKPCGGTLEQCWRKSGTATVEQCWWNSKTVIVQQWNSNGETVCWNRGKVMVEQWGGTVEE